MMAAGSLASIMEFFDIDYDENKGLIMLGIDVILSVKITNDELDIF